MMSYEKPYSVPQLEQQTAEKSMLATWKKSLSIELSYLWNSVTIENVKGPGGCDPSATYAVLNSLVGELTGMII